MGEISNGFQAYHGDKQRTGPKRKSTWDNRKKGTNVLKTRRGGKFGSE